MVLADTAFIKDSEIIGYEITSDNEHNIILSQTAMEKLRTKGRTPPLFSSRSKYPYHFVNRSFAVVVNGQPIYGGWFRSAYISTTVDWIFIPTPFDHDGTGKLSIEKGYMVGKIPDKYGDPRNNKLLIDCLKKSNRLKL